MTKKYELVCILDPQVGESQLPALVEKYEKQLETSGAEVAHIDRWGLRKMAFTSVGLRRRQQGYYVLYQFTASPEVMPAVEEALKLDEGVLRYLLVGVKDAFVRVPQLAPEDVFIFKDTRPPRGGRGRFRDRREEDGPREGGRPPREAPVSAAAEAVPAVAEDAGEPKAEPELAPDAAE